MSRLTDTAPAPFVHRRVINWGDTDAAHIVYTGRFLDFALEAIEDWFRAVVGYGWYEMNMDLGIGTPFVKADIDFKAPLTPRDGLQTTVLVERAGRASITFKVAGERDDGVCSFTGTLVCCVIAAGEMKPVEIPAKWRERIDQYTARCLEASREIAVHHQE
ncbi:MAG: thioesterase family protein [Arenicellales bacterium]